MACITGPAMLNKSGSEERAEFNAHQQDLQAEDSTKSHLAGNQEIVHSQLRNSSGLVETTEVNNKKGSGSTLGKCLLEAASLRNNVLRAHEQMDTMMIAEVEVCNQQQFCYSRRAAVLDLDSASKGISLGHKSTQGNYDVRNGKVSCSTVSKSERQRIRFI